VAPIYVRGTSFQGSMQDQCGSGIRDANRNSCNGTLLLLCSNGLTAADISAVHARMIID
jgi:hypothetical protein